MTTNRAFIKAYRHDTAQPTPTAPALAGPLRPAAASATIELVATANEYLSASVQCAQGVAPLSESIVVLPPAAQPFVDTTHTLVENHIHEPVVPRAPHAPSRSERIAGRKRPLSAYIGRQQAVQTELGGPTQDDAFRPGTTVASFRWPATCRTLAHRCRAELDRVADLLLSEAEGGRRLVGLASLFPGCGATTTLLALAARLSIRKRRMLLIDGHFRRPQLAAWLDVVPTAGWQEVLAEAAPLSDAIIRAADDSIDLLALGAKPAEHPLPLIAGPQTKVCATLIRRHYDLALIDLGAFFDPPSKPIMLELIRGMGVGAALAVADLEETDARDVSTLAEQLGHSGCQLLGRIENRVANLE